MPTLVLGLGSNMGDRLSNLNHAIDAIHSTFGYETTTLESSVYETEPWKNKDQPDFLNMAMAMELYDVPIQQVIDKISQTEMRLGGAHNGKWAPRTIDIDILLYGDMIYDDGQWIIPHPLMFYRLFVMIPLAEIVPKMTHPGYGISIDELAWDAQFNDESKVKITDLR